MQHIPLFRHFSSLPLSSKNPSGIGRSFSGLLCLMGLALLAVAMNSSVASAHQKQHHPHAKDGAVAGVIQSYDSTTGSLSLLTADGKTLTIIVNNQTQISADDGASTTLSSGQKIATTLQQNSDGTFTALTIEVQANTTQNESRAFIGAMQGYDATAQTLTIVTLKGKQVTFATSPQTVLKGADSLQNIPVGSKLLVKAQMQSDGSYTAEQVQVLNKGKVHGKGGDKGGHHGKNGKH